MTFAELAAIAYRNASILVGLACIFAGLLVRESNETNRGLGMALVVVGACMIVIAMTGRYVGWW
jgi:uncharacterized membrane protein